MMRWLVYAIVVLLGLYCSAALAEVRKAIAALAKEKVT
jgi:hypothetical protein